MHLFMYLFELERLLYFEHRLSMKNHKYCIENISDSMISVLFLKSHNTLTKYSEFY